MATVSARDVPPMPWGAVPGEGRVPGVAKFSEARQERITLAWENEDRGGENGLLETGLEATTNFVDWTEVVVLSYRTGVVVTLTNRPGAEFYRAFNRQR